MIILSKYRDYYDYLQGIYGRDEKIVFDRTKGFIPDLSSVKEGDFYDLLVFGVYYKMIFHEGMFYSEEQLNAQNKIYVHDAWRNGDGNWHTGKIVEGRKKDTWQWMDEDEKLKSYKEVLKLHKNCPILILTGGDWAPYPRLQEFRFASIISPQDMWVGLYNWLSKVEDVPNKQDNIQKLESHGFDKKTSFRPKIKEK